MEARCQSQKKKKKKFVLNYNRLFWTSKLQTWSSFFSTGVEQRPEPNQRPCINTIRDDYHQRLEWRWNIDHGSGICSPQRPPQLDSPWCQGICYSNQGRSSWRSLYLRRHCWLDCPRWMPNPHQRPHWFDAWLCTRSRRFRFRFKFIPQFTINSLTANCVPTGIKLMLGRLFATKHTSHKHPSS